MAKTDLSATLSLAGRVERPMPMPLPTRIGGFGGVDGLKTYLQNTAITHVIDATHPFAARMSMHAVQTCRTLGLPLLGLTRPGWDKQMGDTWQHVPDMAGAVAALDRPAARVFLAIGRMHIAEFATRPQHHYVLRLVDPPDGVLPLPKADIIVAKGPFSQVDDIGLLHERDIDIVVSKNSGGTGAYAKIAAARQLGLPVIMIDRPVQPARQEVHSIPDVMTWLRHSTATDLGV